MLIAALELGSDSLVPAPGSRPIDWAGLVPVLEDLPLRIPAIRIDPIIGAQEGSLASSNLEEVALLWPRVKRSAEIGKALNCPLLILELPRVQLIGEAPSGTELSDCMDGIDADSFQALAARIAAERDRLLENCCRNLFRLCQDFPEFRFCLTEPSDLCAISDTVEIELILTDLSRFEIGYWHRPALVAFREHLGGIGHGESLEMLRKYLLGSDLSDFDAQGLQALPGAGRVDYGLLLPHMRGLTRSLPAVLELSPQHRCPEMRQALGYLENMGF